MCEPVTIAAIGLTAYSGYTQGRAQRAQGEAKQAYYDYLANQSEQEAALALKTGQTQADLIQTSAKEQGKQLKKSQAQLAASQRVAMAASGVDSSSVTSQDITSDTFDTQKLDELALRYNADVQTWGTLTDASYKDWSLKSQASQYRYAGENARYAGKIAQRNTLLNTAVSIAGSAAGMFSSSTSTQGLTGWLKGYGKGTPKNAVNYGGVTWLN